MQHVRTYIYQADPNSDTYVHVCSYSHMYMQLCTCMDTHVHMHAQAQAHMHKHTCMHVCIHAYTSYMRAHPHTHL